MPGMCSGIIKFQSALPRGERLQCYADNTDCEQFQSALPRGERPESTCKRILFFKISIRAPARGATITSREYMHHLLISIRAPARGATLSQIIPGGIRDISIRAPARGATMVPLPILAGQGLFQSALPRGERLNRY